MKKDLKSLRDKYKSSINYGDIGHYEDPEKYKNVWVWYGDDDGNIHKKKAPPAGHDAFYGSGMHSGNMWHGRFEEDTKLLSIVAPSGGSEEIPQALMFSLKHEFPGCRIHRSY